MKMPLRAAALSALLGLATSPAFAQVARATPGQPEARTALELMPAKARLTVTTPALKDGGDIPFENTQYRSNTFPGLSLSKGPAGTRSYVLIMQDNDLLVRGAFDLQRDGLGELEVLLGVEPRLPEVRSILTLEVFDHRKAGPDADAGMMS